MTDKANPPFRSDVAMQHGLGLRGTAAVFTVAIALAAAACTPADAEQAVRTQLAALQGAIDARDAGAVEDLLAEDFIGNEGLDRRGAKQMAAAVFLRHRDVGARLGPIEVELRGSTDAIARFTVVATGGSGGLVPESGQVYRVETGWRLIKGEWRLLNATWSP